MKIRTTTAASVTGLLGRPKRLPPGIAAVYALEFQLVVEPMHRFRGDWQARSRKIGNVAFSSSTLVE
jgi:hypothetical protein